MVLVENDFSHKSLIALLAYLVETGSKVNDRFLLESA